MTCRILFTGGGGAGNEALFRLLSDRYECHFADADKDAIDASIPSAQRHAIPFASDPEFAVQVSGLCTDQRIDLLIPGVDEELTHIAAIQSRAPALKVLAPNQNYIERMGDKLSMIRALEQHNLDAPKTWTLENIRHAHFPCIIKPRAGRGSRGVCRIEKPAQVAAYIEMESRSPDDIILQEIGDGTEYTVQMIADAEGRLQAVVPVRVAIKRGITLRATTEANVTVETACRRIHDAWPTGGCYNIQLMLTPDGRILPFEINPRISTTFCLVVAAGIDPIGIFLGHESSTSENAPFRPGVSLARYWQNHFSDQTS